MMLVEREFDTLGWRKEPARFGRSSLAALLRLLGHGGTAGAADSAGQAVGDGVLLVTAVPLKRNGKRVFLDDQTCAGLERWADNFESVVYVGIDAADARSGEPESSITWRDTGELRCAGRLEMIVLPRAYRVREFLSAYRPARTLLANRIHANRYLCFTLGALVGDWGGVAALEAIEQSRDYAVWFDRVEHDVIRNTMSAMTARRRLKERATLPTMERYHRYLVSRSALGLFQGQDCYRTYAPFAKQPFCVYDTHTDEVDKISSAELDAKISRVLTGGPLQICYVGRAAEMKGPYDWLKTIRIVRDAGVEVNAVWLGDGPLLEGMAAEVRRLGLARCVSLAGFQGDRQKVLAEMRAADFFLFCHKTPESPRCLVEALVSGAPLIGFESAYANELTATQSCGRFVPTGDAAGLARLVIEAHADRAGLAGLIRDAAVAGSRFDEKSVYQERCALIKRHL